MYFRDRREAGQLLALELEKYGSANPIVLAIPRGGVVIGAEVAASLDCLLDLIVPRKLGSPFNPELAIGAVVKDGSTYLNRDTIAYIGVSQGYIEEEKKKQVVEIERRLKKYRGDRPEPNIKDETVILTDDGVATGATIRAAIRSIRSQEPEKLVVAVPVGPADTIEELKSEVDEVVCLYAPEVFYAVGGFYAFFEQTTDNEVVELLKENWKKQPH